jgi:iron complex outermembrane receptor protein
VDWAPGRDQVTVQGDVYDGSEHQPLVNNQLISGHNLVGRWTRTFSDGSTLQVQAYYDYLERKVADVYGDFLHAYDLDVQHSFRLGAAHEIVWGGGYRRTKDRFPIVPDNVSSHPYTQFFQPERRSLGLANVFVQDTIEVTPAFKVTAGVKLEDDPYTAVQALPSLRLAWQVSERSLLWAAASRAIRAPSRVDRDFYQVLGPALIIRPGDFQSEKLNAYELGYRGQPSRNSSLSISAFYNVYDDLRSFERAPSGGLPLTFENRLEGKTYGVEAWGSYEVSSWWRLSGGATWLHEDLRFQPGSGGDGGVQIAGNDPKYQAQVRSQMDLTNDVSLDLHLRRVGRLPAPVSPAYTELNGRLGWAVTDAVELSVSGFNLLHKHHAEFGSMGSNVQLGASGVETGRSVVVDARLRF